MTIDDGLVAEVHRAVDDGFDEQVALTRALVACPSLPRDERDAQILVEQAFVGAGLDVDRLAVDDALLRQVADAPVSTPSPDGSFDVIGRRTGGGSGPTLAINGHIDVVPPGARHLWTRDPFDPHVEDGWLYGRGSGDMKAGLVAGLAAVAALDRAGIELEGSVVLQSVVEEECSGNGALACVAASVEADAVLLPEPVYGALMRAQMGIMWVRVRVDGSPAHASVRHGVGTNAIEAAWAIWDRVRWLESEWNGRRDSYPPFDDGPEPVRFVLGTIHGGDWPSSVPASCTIEFRCSTFPGQPLGDARAEIEQAVVAAAVDLELASIPEVSYPGLMAEGYVVPQDARFEATMRAASDGAGLPPLVPWLSPAGSDARFFGNHANVPAVMFGPRAERIHGIDERVELDSVRRVTVALALAAIGWCGTP